MKTTQYTEQQMRDILINKEKELNTKLKQVNDKLKEIETDEIINYMNFYNIKLMIEDTIEYRINTMSSPTLQEKIAEKII